MPIMIGSNKDIYNDIILSKDKLNEAYNRVKLFDCLKECPNDPKGYFIIKGVEKVFLLQEELAHNRFFIEEDKNKELIANIKSSTIDTIIVSSIINKEGKLYVKCNRFKSPISLFIFFKAYGVESE